MTTTNKKEFVNKITIKLSEYENERRKRLFKFILIQLLKISLLVIFLIFLYKYTNASIQELAKLKEFWIIIAIVAGIMFNIFSEFKVADKNFKKFLKKKCHYKNVTKALNLKISSRGKISKFMLEDCELFPEFTHQKTDDVITGCYKGVEFTLTETELIRVERSEDKEKTYVVFKGVIISFPSNKKIGAQTIITPKHIDLKQFIDKVSSYVKTVVLVFIVIYILIMLLFAILVAKDTTGKIMLISFGFLFVCAYSIHLYYILAKKKKYETEEIKYQKIKLEDADFEKLYNVSSKNQVEARYLLTPTFMDRLKSLETSFGTKGIKCSFFDDNIMFAIPTKKDLFELGSLYHSLKSQKQIEEFYNELESIQQMIDHFKLNENTGL